VADRKEMVRWAARAQRRLRCRRRRPVTHGPYETRIPGMADAEIILQVNGAAHRSTPGSATM
jgi:hypothetical protein